jgi:signal transduction histidine kinase
MRKVFRPYPLAIAAAGVCLFIRLFIFKVSGWVLVLAIAEPLVIIGLGYLSYKYWERSQRSLDFATREHDRVLALESEKVELSDRYLSLQRDYSVQGDLVESLVHTLSTPLSVIATAADLLQNEELSDRGEKYLATLKFQSQSASKLVKDLLKSVRLEAGMLELQLGSIKIDDWLPNIVRGFVPSAAARQLDISHSVELPMPVLVTDAEMLADVLNELIRNAIKYSRPRTEIKVVARFDKKRDRHLIEVTNDGIIFDREREAIWDRFYRIPKSDLYNQGGSGLGLYCAKQSIKLLGGTIAMRSVPAKRLVTFLVEL